MMNKRPKIILAVILCAIAVISIGVIAFVFCAGADDGVSLFEGLVLGSAISELDSRDPLEADVTVSVDVFSLKFDHDLKMYRFKTENEPIFAADYGLGKTYFNSKLSCDEKGNIVSEKEARELSLGEMLGAVAYLYEKGSPTCDVKKGIYTYRLALDRAAMQEIAYYIAPEAEEYNISFTSGTLIATVSDSKVVKLKIVIGGSVDAYITDIPVHIGAELDFNNDRSTATLPKSVKDTLSE